MLAILEVLEVSHKSGEGWACLRRVETVCGVGRSKGQTSGGGMESWAERKVETVVVAVPLRAPKLKLSAFVVNICPFYLSVSPR